MGSRSNIVQTCEHNNIVGVEGLTCSLCEYHRSQEGQVTTLRDVCQRIRAGWLPHRVGDRWWYGRPSAYDGFSLWSEGKVPTMLVVEPMPDTERDAWMATLHPMAEAPASGRCEPS
jgi:hypothetical protein